MSTPGDDHGASADDRLIDSLRRAALLADPPPAALADAARAAIGMARLDEELAELLHDSALESAGAGTSGGSGGGLRASGDEGPRLVSFGTTEVGADIEIGADIGTTGCAVRGQVSGPVTSAALQTPTSRLPLTLDDRGRFSIDAVGGAALRLELTTDSGYTVVTPWVRAG